MRARSRSTLATGILAIAVFAVASRIAVGHMAVRLSETTARRTIAEIEMPFPLQVFVSRKAMEARHLVDAVAGVSMLLLLCTIAAYVLLRKARGPIVAVIPVLAIATILVGPIVVADRCPSCGGGSGWLHATTSVPWAGVTVVAMLGAWLSSAAVRAGGNGRSISDDRSSRSPEVPPAVDASA